MNSVLIELVPLIIGAAVVPIWIIIVLLLLRGEGGLPSALAFVAGQVLFRLGQGIVVGFIFASSAVAKTEAGGNLIVSTLLLVVGILLWITAVIKWFKVPDPDEPPPGWMKIFHSVSAPKAFGFALLLMAIAIKQWVFALGALEVINKSALTLAESIIAYLIFILGAQFLILVPIVIRAALPRQSAHLLESGSQWLERNNRMLVIVVSVVFGAYFIFKGITGLVS
ncbi:MAG: hypothetical protein EYC68_02130 [Chloroflexota bacterium]|nr:MAG: hypothetical protein EYC68_02130 [Chloroflexota bacterium]